jgi:hypothetical protein
MPGTEYLPGERCGKNHYNEISARWFVGFDPLFLPNRSLSLKTNSNNSGEQASPEPAETPDAAAVAPLLYRSPTEKGYRNVIHWREEL